MKGEFISAIRKENKHNFISFVNPRHLDFLKLTEKHIPIELSNDRNGFILVRVKEGEHYLDTSIKFWAEFRNRLNYKRRRK